MQDGEEEEDGWAQGGGFLRGGLRNVLGRIGKTALGSFPLPNNPKVLAKQADKLSEVWNSALKVRAERSVLAQQKLDDAKARSRYIWFVPILNALPSIVKSSVLGALVFTTYETVLTVNSLQELAPGPFGPSLFAGWCSGTVHGFASYIWDKALLHTFPRAVERWDRLITFRNTALLGTVVSHSCMHASLFGGYSAFKELLSEANSNPQPSSLEQQVVVVSAGAMAGALADGIAYYLQPLEVGQGWSGVRQLPKPAARAILLAAIPSGIGFFAMEYA